LSLKSGEKAVSGIVDQDIKGAELIDRLTHRAFGIGRFGQVKPDRVGLSRMSGEEIGDSLGVADGQGNLMTAEQGFRG